MQNSLEFKNKLEVLLAELTHSEQRIAAYLMNYYEQAALFSAAELAQQLQISEATVVRFARRVGYSGYPALHRDLLDILHEQATTSSRLQTKLADLKSSPGHVFTKTVEMEIKYLVDAEQSINLEDFDKAVEIILAGRRLFIVSGGPSSILADLLDIRLRRFGMETVLITETGRNIYEKLLLLQPDDAVIVAAFHNITKELTAVLSHSANTGCRSVFITDTLGPFFADKATVILSAMRGPMSTFHSQTIPMVILNALILAIALARPDSSLSSLKKLDTLRGMYGTG